MTTESSTVKCPDCNEGEQYYRLGNTERLVKCDQCEGTGEIGPDSVFYDWAVRYWKEHEK